MTGASLSQASTIGRWQRVARLLIGPFAGVRIDFGHQDLEKKLTITFSFISGLVGRVILMTFVWAVAAGVLQTGRLILKIDILAPHSSLVADWIALVGLEDKPFLLIFCLSPIYALKAFGVAMLLFLAAACVGAIIGFLFGVPRPFSESGAPSTTLNGGPVQPLNQSQNFSLMSNGRTNPLPGWQANTNLTQISDWLTKIIVGVSLVEFHNIILFAISFQKWSSSQLFEGFIGVNLVIPTMVISGIIIGFLHFYLFTQLFLASLLSISARALAENPTRTITGMSGSNHAVAKPIEMSGRGAPAITDAEPTEDQRAAAISIASQSLESLFDADAVVVWARSQAVLNQWAAAVTGYERLLQMRRRPEELAEAARVYASAGKPVRARELTYEAILGRDRAPPEARGPMTFDAVYFSLYDKPPGGYTRALSLLGPDFLESDHRGGLFVLRACANGQRLQHEEADLNDKARGRIRGEMLKDLRKALHNKENLPWIRFLMGRDDDGHPLPPPKENEYRDDDLDAVRTDPEFVALVAPEQTGAAPAVTDELPHTAS